MSNARAMQNTRTVEIVGGVLDGYRFEYETTHCVLGRSIRIPGRGSYRIEKVEGGMVFASELYLPIP